MSKRLLITTALPYANGDLHLGHLVGYVMTDVFARFQRMRGRRAIYVCADDTHGTAIMIRARQEGKSEVELIREMQEHHEADFEAFDIRFDHYHSTHSDECRELAARIWKGVRERGLVTEREVTQLYDVKERTFLADRFVKGACPNCKSPDQYGDSCDKCGATYAPTDVIDPISTLSGTRPEVRKATHLFVRIEDLRPVLVPWVESGALEPEVVNYLKGQFLAQPLRDWDVSRPAPYFGFEIPDAPGHYFYVWFDAPIGYIASTLAWAKEHGETLEDWWASADCDIHHFLGKDIVYFHALFWPALLHCGGFSLPAKEWIHGHLTINGEKMSKSKGTFVLARDFLRAGNDAQQLRYFFASKLTPRPEDLDLDFDEFAAKVNADLVGKVVNLASRTARFVAKAGLASAYPDDGGLFEQGAAQAETIADLYERCELAQAMRAIMTLADRANEYVEKTAPWSLAKDAARAGELQSVSTVALNLFRQIAVYLSPVLPKLARDAGALLNAPIERWDDAKAPIVGRSIAAFEHLMARVDSRKLAALTPIAAPETKPAATEVPTATKSGSDAGAIAPAPAAAVEPLADTIAIDDFVKLDLRVAEVLGCEKVAKSNKLLKVRVSLGPLGERTIYAGIQKSYAPEQLVGKRLVVVANLAPREMKGIGVSEGMILAAGGDVARVLLPDAGARPGDRVR
jgi:methionyl-tRNA synthetase